MTDLSQLLEKVRTAEAGSRELDATICVSVQYGGGNSEGATNARTDPDWEGDLLFEIGPEECCNPIPPVTTSLDAIVSLIERELPNTMRRVEHCEDGDGSRCDLVLENGSHIMADGADWPLALCAAFLSAMLSAAQVKS